jgi:hypothetical protein
MECLYLWAEDLGHVLEVKWGPVGDGYADWGGPGGDARGCMEECVGHDVGHTRYKQKVALVFLYECQVELLAARGWQRHLVEGENQRLVVCPELEGAALQAVEEMFDT